MTTDSDQAIHGGEEDTFRDTERALRQKIDWLKGQIDSLANFNPDWDMLEATQRSLREHMATIKSLTAEGRSAFEAGWRGGYKLGKDCWCPTLEESWKLYSVSGRQQPPADNEDGQYGQLLAFADGVSDTIWGGESGWYESGLPTMLLELRKRLKTAFRIEFSHESVDAFWKVWQEVGEPHKHGVYESTWMSFKAAMAAGGKDQRADRDDSRQGPFQTANKIADEKLDGFKDCADDLNELRSTADQRLPQIRCAACRQHDWDNCTCTKQAAAEKGQ